MREKIKKIYTLLPIPAKRVLLSFRELYFSYKCKIKEKKEYKTLPRFSKKQKIVKNILIYHISGMYYAGTEKTLQLIANHLVEDYNVFFMYSQKNFSQRQKDLMDKRITLLEFSYRNIESAFPYFIHGMDPHIKNIMAEFGIDILITADSGHSQYPFNTIQDIPIILINIFGSPSLQKNIISTVFISKEIMDYSEKFTGKRKTNQWAHLAVTPSDIKENTSIKRNTVRSKVGIPLDAFVFGRIGRGSDSIFDPIGISAFEEVVQKHPEAHYLIMSPPPILVKIVKEKNIPNVHYMTDKEDIWDFYAALDALAHFRLDGETFGLNIAEAMFAGNPIISHKSHIWNAHLEYLKPSFSRVAEKDNVQKYASFMKEFILLKKNNPQIWNTMRNVSMNTARTNFSPERYGNTIKKIIESYNEKFI